MQILFYRELEFPLNRIRSILTASDYARESALSEQLHALKARQKRIEALIATATRTLNALKGDLMMKDTEKFEGFKAEIIAKNEDRYGEEIRSRYGDATVDGVNARIQGMGRETWHKLPLITMPSSPEGLPSSGMPWWPVLANDNLFPGPGPDSFQCIVKHLRGNGLR
ncbi:MerR family DNA-binding protein [Eubacterium barkeri]|uniref:MerR, DNA binding n=1 Tax=Eubacterium barkeri TaxID=1528 RepID=A0A1H3HLV7_EUBBA|nr:MerR family DNA-binding protein [Eubacterium barkeri]SDY16493.1 MerR, DNA binding [Eubacterium barkeri]